jgi:predicted nuclease with TOPRIM domain
MKDTKSLLLAMLSVGLTGTWVYHLYDKTQYSKKRNEVFIKDSTAVAQGVQDSLHKIYSKTITDLDVQLDSTRTTAGQLKGELGNKLLEIYKLRVQISSILKLKNISKEDLLLARKKTTELQQLVQELESKNFSIEEEKQQITASLDKVNLQVKSLEDNMQELSKENKVLSEKVSLASTFIASELIFSPITLKKDKELETSSAAKANKIVISFAVSNNISDYENAEVYVAVIQPDGNVMMIDAWESSSMIDTKNEGKKKYTRKIKFEYQKGETKRLTFSLNPDGYQKGTYSVQLYHNGYLIGKTSKTLN